MGYILKNYYSLPTLVAFELFFLADFRFFQEKSLKNYYLLLIFFFLQNTNGALKTINSSRLTVDPEGSLWFSNVTRKDASNQFFYACSAASFFRSEYKLGNRVVLQVGSVFWVYSV